MSISSEITRISGNVSDALTAIAAKGVTVPSGSNSDDLADLIAAISGVTPSATQHTILFEFTDETTQSITGYWDSSFISDAITATEPITIGQKTVDTAALDGVTWYARPTTQWETLYSGNATIVSSSPNSISILNFPETIGEDETWRITWGGVEYVCTPQYSSQIGGCFIGNSTIVGGSDSGNNEPFWAYKRTSSQLAFSTNRSAGNITLKIEKQVS